MTQEAMKLALEALENVTEDYVKNRQYTHNKAITAIKKALAQTQEPVAYVNDDGAIIQTGLKILPSSLLYTAPPQRTEQEPLIGCVNHDCDKCKAQKSCVYCGQLVGKEKNI